MTLTSHGKALAGRLSWLAASVCACILPGPAPAQQRSDFEIASRVLAQGSPVVGGRIQPHWIGRSGTFWYQRTHRAGVDYVHVDAAKAASSILFTQREIDQAVGGPADEAGAAVSAVQISAGSAVWTARISRSGQAWRCARTTVLTCVRDGTIDLHPGELASPDDNWRVFVDDHNLFVRRAGHDERIQLTFDGEKDDGYENIARSDAASDAILRGLLGPTVPDVTWSPDSRRILALRTDMRGTRNAYMIQSGTASGSPRLFTLKKPWAGDANIGTVEVDVIDVESKSIWRSARQVDFMQRAQWLPSGNSIWTLFYNRGGTESRLTIVDFHKSATARATIVERDARPVHHGPDFYGFGAPPGIAEIDDRLMLLWSERDGWGHLYLVDTRTGKTVRQVTSGAWMVDTIISVDTVRQQVYFSARGREPGRDVYLRHLYRVSYAKPDEPVLLTPEDANHQEENGEAFSPDHRFFVDSFSRVDQPPRAVLRTTDGRLVLALDQAEFKDDFAAGTPMPERFVVRSADDGTDIYGTLYKPRNFDPSRLYPILDDYYPGVFSVHEPRFGELQWGVSNPQATAEIGAIVVQIDGRGTSYRSKAFRASGYGSLGASGIVDHIAAIRSLATTRKYLNLEKVGIYGHSNGGDGTIRAMIDHGDFFKVGVASGMSGANFFTHEPQYGELWIGNPFTERQKWLDIAATNRISRITGKLLILHGEMDDHANPAFVHRFITAAIDRNISIDTMFVPNVNHDMTNVLTGASNEPHFYNQEWRYLKAWLDKPRGQ